MVFRGHEVEGYVIVVKRSDSLGTVKEGGCELTKVLKRLLIVGRWTTTVTESIRYWGSIEG